MNKKIVWISIVVILIGIIMITIKGFNVDLKYKKHEVIQVVLGQEYSEKDVKDISKEVFGKKKIYVEKVGIYGDAVNINVENSTSEEINNLVSKLNEKYGINQKIVVQIAEGFDTNEIENMTKEIIGKDSIKVEKQEDDEKSAVIVAGIITDEQAEALANSINEKYGTELTKDSINVSKSVDVTSVGKVTLKDMAKQYTFYVIIATVAVVAYFVIRYRKLGVANVLSKSVLLIVLSELLFISIMAIIRYPINKLVIIAALTIYLAVITYLNKTFIDGMTEAKNNK